jgi:hypothetical protein
MAQLFRIVAEEDRGKFEIGPRWRWEVFCINGHRVEPYEGAELLVEEFES